MTYLMRSLLRSMRQDVHLKGTSKAMVYWHLGRICGYSYADHDDIGNIAARNEANFLINYWSRHHAN